MAHGGQKLTLGPARRVSGLLGGAQASLLLSLSGHVRVDAHHTDGQAIGIIVENAAGLDMANGAIRAQQTELIHIGLIVFQGRKQHRLGAVCILRVQSGAPVVEVEPAATLTLGNLIPVAQPFIPLQRVVGKVPAPDADVGRIGGQGEPLQRTADLGLRLYPIGDIPG